MVGFEERPLISPSSPSRARADITEIVHAGLDAVDAARLLEIALTRDEPWGAAAAQSIDLVAAGKAAGPMADAAIRRFGSRLRAGVVTASRSGSVEADGLDWIAAAHPLPDKRSLAAGRRALDIAAQRQGRDGLLVLLSGGASSMLAVPAPGVSLGEKVSTTALLLQAGAVIHELNAVRKHLSAIKGGRLAADAGPVRTYAVSDVVAQNEDDPSVIGSGPTVPDPSTFADALQVVERLGVREACPAAALTHLESGRRGDRPETTKPGDSSLADSTVRIIGNRHDAMAGAAAAAARLGYLVVTWQEPVTGEAREAAAEHARRVLRLATGVGRPLCLLSSGETTVRVTGDGRGGRNQEFALALVRRLAHAPRAVTVACAGTDGVDGPTDAAGAVVDGESLDRSRSHGLEAPELYLARNDAYSYFEPLGDLIRTGPTGTNVGDLQVSLVWGGMTAE